MIDHVVSELNDRQRTELFKVYVTDLLRYIAKSVGMEVSVSYSDLMEQIKPRRQHKEQNADEIISNIQAKIGALQ